MRTTASDGKLELVCNVADKVEIEFLEECCVDGVGWAYLKQRIAIRTLLNKEINAGLATTTMKSRLADLGGTALSGSPEEFGKLIAEETEKVGQGGEVLGHKSRLMRSRQPNFDDKGAAAMTGRRSHTGS